MPTLRRTRKNPHKKKKRPFRPPVDWPDLERYKDRAAGRMRKPRLDQPVGSWGRPPVFLAVLAVSFFLAIVVLVLSPPKIDWPSLSLLENDSAAAASLMDYPTSDAIAPFFMPSVHYWGEQIASWSEEWDLDPNLIATVMQIESCGDPQAQSGAGAMGLFQVMPYPFQAGEDPFDPHSNAARGLAYLAQSFNATNGDILLTLAGYNGGITGPQRPDNLWPDETHRYTYWGIGIYTEAHSGLDESPTLQEWLSNGGATLCSQATLRLGIGIP